MLQVLRFTPQGVVAESGAEAAARPAAEGEVRWINLFQPTPDEGKVLSDVFRFHPVAIDDCLADVHHPKVDDYGEYLFLIIHALRPGAKTFETKELDIFLGKGFLVTHHKEPMDCVSRTWEHCVRTPHIFHQGDDLLHEILDGLVTDYNPVLDDLDRRVDLVEDSVFSNPTRDTLDSIFQLKKELMRVRKISAHQREMLSRLCRGEFALIGDKVRIYLRDVYDHLVRVVDLEESYRDLVTGAMDAYLSSVSNRMAEVMKVLTVISTIMMFMALVAGIYGMNFKSLWPDTEWGPGFWTVIGFMGAIAAGALYAFRRRGWF